MSENQIVATILGGVLVLIIVLSFTASALSKRVSDNWLMVGFLVFALSAATCWFAARMRLDADRRARLEKSDKQ